MSSLRLRLAWGLRAIGLGVALIFGGLLPRKKGNMTFSNPGVTFGDAAKTQTGIWGAITGTLGVALLWINALQPNGGGINAQLIGETLAAFTLWMTLVHGRKAVAKGPAI